MTTGNNPAFLRRTEPLAINEIQSALIVAPHPDDESLGCGGTIALLRQAGIPVTVLFVTDGSMSHPASAKYPSSKLCALRETEALSALRTLGVDASAVGFMAWKDGSVPACDEPGFRESVHRMRAEIKERKPAALFVPWRRDPHKDHRATAAIVQEALVDYPLPVRVLEYFIWLWERSKPEDLPSEKEAVIRHVNIEAVMSLKKEAVMAHESQVTDLIDDDPEGFRLSPEVLAHFWGNAEFFAEAKPEKGPGL